MSLGARLESRYLEDCPNPRPEPMAAITCFRLRPTLHCLLAAMVLGVAAPAIGQGSASVALEAEDDAANRRAGIRASVSQFMQAGDSGARERRHLSDAERVEMRRQIDEAIRKAYGTRQRIRR